MKFQELLLELMLLQADLERLRSFGLEIQEEVEIGPYTLLLLKHRHSNEYTVSLTSEEKEFTTPGSQVKITTQQSNAIARRSFIDMMQKLRQWVNMFGKIEIGSWNNKRTVKYKRLIDTFGEIDTTPVETKYGGSYFFAYTK